MIDDPTTKRSPLMQQAMGGLFHLPWPRKPLDYHKGKGGSRSRAKSRGGKSGSAKGGHAAAMRPF